MTKRKAPNKKPDKSPITKDGSESDSSKLGSVPQSPVTAPTVAMSPITSPLTSPTMMSSGGMMASHGSSSAMFSCMGAIRPSPTAWFTAEIQHMMHGFGDVRRPLQESAELIEEIVHYQLTSLLYQVAEVTSMRGSRYMGIEDFLFLVRRDKTKLRRLIRYMSLKDVKVAGYKGEEEEVAAETVAGDLKQVPKPVKKRRNICYEFISSIDQTGELLALFDDDGMDEVKHERALRADLQTRHMDSQQYVEYCEARQASFAPRFKSQKFKDWITNGINVEPKPNPIALEVLVYMAYEIVAQIVDLSMLVKRDQQAEVDDPFIMSMPAVCVNRDLPVEPPSAPSPGAQPPPPRSPSRAPSPVTSPPSTPTTPSTPMPGSGALTAGGSQTAASANTPPSSRSKPKKRKKNDPASRDLSANLAIQPSHIREVLRRYSQSIGPFADYSKMPLISCRHRIFCL